MGDVLVVGGGIFGVTAALELAARGERVALHEAGPLPHPDAASTDISKVVRMDYGRDAFYVELMEQALPRFRAWNRESGRALFVETGFCMLTARKMSPDGFEGASYDYLAERGHRLERLDGATLAARQPSWRQGRFVDGYLNPVGGWAPSGKVVAWLAERAREAGVTVVEHSPLHAIERDGGRVVALELGEERLEADRFVIAAGAATPSLVVETAPFLRATAQPIFHFAPEDPRAFADLTVWAADIATTGWYGFPPNEDGIIKVANHGPGLAYDTPATWDVMETRCRDFLRDSLPALAEAPIVTRRICRYCDSLDGDLWIDRVPETDNLFVAAGGSGHAFKLAPMLGEIIADVVLGAQAWPRFAWREPGTGNEAARAVSPG